MDHGGGESTNGTDQRAAIAGVAGLPTDRAQDQTPEGCFPRGKWPEPAARTCLTADFRVPRSFGPIARLSGHCRGPSGGTMAHNKNKERRAASSPGSKRGAWRRRRSGGRRRSTPPPAAGSRECRRAVFLRSCHCETSQIILKTSEQCLECIVISIYLPLYLSPISLSLYISISLSPYLHLTM